MAFVLLLCIFAVGAWAVPLPAEESAARKSYEKYNVYQMIPAEEHQLKLLYGIYTDSAEYFKLDFWQAPTGVGKPVQVMVPPEQQTGFLAMLENARIEHSLYIENVEKLIMNEQADLKLAASKRDSNFDFTNYHSYDEIMTYIKSLPTTYPDIASTFDIGKSSENRQMTGIKIGKAGSNKKAVWIDAGIHAREWIAPATALYIINELTSKYATDSNIKKLVDQLDWYILPSANPDGYEYTRATDRMWRKTRSKQKCSIFQCCYGADPNRNFGYQWGGSGTSSNPCSDIFRGTAAFSEPETKAMSEAILARKDQLGAMLTLHSFGQWYLVPYGYIDPPVYPADYSELLKVAQDSAAALQAVHGTRFTVGNSDELLYAAAGASDDWSKGVAGIKYVYTIELRPSNSDPAGFVLPASYITPTGEETWAAVQVVAQRVLAL